MYSVLTWPQMTVCTFWNIWFWILVRLRVQISNLTLPQVILPSSNRHKSFREQRTCKLQKCTHHWVQFSNFACKTDKTKHFFLIENTCRMVSVCGFFFQANINIGMFMEKFIYLVYQIRFCSGQTQGQRIIFHMSGKNIFCSKRILSAFFFFFLTWDFLSKWYFSYNVTISPTNNFNRQKTLEWTLFLFFMIKSFLVAMCCMEWKTLFSI